MPSSALVDTYSRFGLGKATNLGLVGESSGIYPKKQRWSDIERATFSFGYGLMVAPLQLARVYATIGSLGVYRPLSITKVDPPVAGERVFPEPLVRTVVHMMESVALPGGGGVKAAIKGYRIAIKTGTAKKWARTANTSTDTSLIPPASRRQVTPFCPGGRHQRPAGWEILWWRNLRAGVRCHHGRRIAHHEHRA